MAVRGASSSPGAELRHGRDLYQLPGFRLPQLHVAIPVAGPGEPQQVALALPDESGQHGGGADRAPAHLVRRLDECLERRVGPDFLSGRRADKRRLLGRVDQDITLAPGEMQHEADHPDHVVGPRRRPGPHELVEILDILRGQRRHRLGAGPFCKGF